MKHERVMIITDSLGMPRDETGWDVCWPHLLMNHFSSNEYISRSLRYSTTQRLINEGISGKDCLEWYRPNVSILQLGICDCAPRLFSKNSLYARLIDKFPITIKNYLYELVESVIGRKLKNAWVNIFDFESNVNDYFARAKNIQTKVVAIAIFHPGQAVLNRNPRINESVNLYNAALMRQCNAYGMIFIGPYDSLNSDAFTVDGYHLNEFGHRWLFEQVAKALKGDNL